MPALLIPILTEIIGQTGILSPDAIVKYFGLALSAVTHFDGADDRLTKVKEHMLSMVAEGRDPTDSEWNTVTASIEDSLDRIARA